MSTQAIHQTSIDDFANRVNRLYNRSQKLRDSIVEFGQRWNIRTDHVDETTMTASAEPAVQTYTEPEPIVNHTQPIQPVVEEPVEMHTDANDLDLDSLLAGIKLDDDELSL